uniref:Protein TIC 214 n=1 Tax=Pteroceltis tatarinowii TaxID=63062 RepID=A0A3P8MVU9_9ROSA|nr:hypothetical protein RF1 [Pteroceltis tatarinowii]AXX77370.1 hypothetical protein RF1 [Pteroceltis tatarinowii]QWK48096.1 hypothetical protein RF1 [Pteroceltis tatarinowii]
MIFQSFLLGNLVSLCMKIINSVVVVGLYYGFLTTFSIGPSYLFLLRARLMEEGEEGTEKKVSATTGFITGQLMMFISIYYVPLHLALGRPHTITVLALPYLLFHFFWNNHKHFFDYGSTNRNSMRNLSIQCVFLNNLIFQLFNHFILPSSMLVRLVNIYMFRCNNKMLFVTSSFVGWLIGHILFMKWVGLVLVWIQQNNSIRSNVLIRSNKYLVAELRNFMARIFSILLFITCVYYLGRIPSPIVTKKLKETLETEETDVEIETTSERKGTKQEQEGSTEEDPSPSLFSEEKEDPDKIDETEEIRVNGKEKTKDEFQIKETQYKNRPLYETYYLDVDRNQENSKLNILKEKPLVTILFDYKRWNRPFRYIKNDRFENAVRNEMSQYFFHTCQSDGKERLSFTYPPSLSIFFEMIQRKMSLFTTEKPSSNELYNHWGYNNEEKKKKLNNKFINRVKYLDKTLINSKSLILDVLEKRIRLYNDNTKKEYLPKIYDPFLNGAYRGRIKKLFSLSIQNEIYIQNYIERDWINKIHGLLFIINYLEFEPKKNKFSKMDRKSLKKEMSFFLNLINQFTVKSISSFNLKKNYLFTEHKEGRINSEGRKKQIKFIFDRVLNDPNNNRKESIGLKEIRKKVPRWSYKLINNLEHEEGEIEEMLGRDPEIRSRKSKRVLIFNHDLENPNLSSNPQDTNNDETNDITLIRYSQQSDFRRDIITGSMRAQRRKIIICKSFQANVHSPLFLDRIGKDVFFSFNIFESFSFNIFESVKKKFQNWFWLWKNKEFNISDYREKKEKERTKKNKEKKKEEARIKIAEAWDSIVIAQIIRGLALVTQSILRKYIILPLLIIVKNLIRILLFQFPEWSEDLKDWKRERHVKCTYNGIQLSEKEFPKNWLIDGIQIKILFPFRLKPWHKAKFKLRETYKDPMKKKEQKNDFCFLTVLGMETELPFGSPRKQISFFEPIFKELKKKLIKLKKKSLRVLIIVKERTKFFLTVSNVSKETKKWVIKHILFLKKKIKELSKMNPILLFEVKKSEIYELGETKKEKDLIINNEIMDESSINIQSTNKTTFSLTKKKIQDLTDRTNTIINKIQKIPKDNKKGFRSLHRNIFYNKISYGDKRLELQKKILQILKRRKARLIRKSHLFFKFFIERVSINIFLFISNIHRINVQVFFYFFKSTKKNFNKYSSYNKTNQNITQFISTIKKSISNINISGNKARTLYDLSYLSQAYVFYKLSQTPIFNLFNLYKSKLRSVFQYQYKGRSLFLKNEIKDYFVRTQEIFNSELIRHKNPYNSGINQWKNWLKGYYQYDLSQPRLIPQKVRNIVNQDSIVQNKHFKKGDSDEKNRLINFEKQNKMETNPLLNQKKNIKKQYRYNLLSYNFINHEMNYEDKKNSSIYEFPLQVNHNQEIFYNYKKDKQKFFNMLIDIPINNYLVEENFFIIDIETNPDRKFFDWIILNFCLRNQIDIGAWINTNTDTKSNSNKYTKTQADNYQLIDKIDKKGLVYPTIHQNQEINPYNKKKLFDWMRINEEIISCPISNLELWFFPEFLILYNSYKIKPCEIPIKLLLLNFNGNENVSENKSTTGKKKIDIFISIFSNEKKYLELENQNRREKDFAIQENFESTLSNQAKDIEENYMVSKKKKDKNKKQYKNNMEVGFDFVLKRYLLFQLRWDDSLNTKMINNIKVYCLLLRLINPREITIASIQRGEMSLDILMIQKNVNLTELIKRGILLIEPVRLSITNEGQFIVYQTIGISLLHTSTPAINQINQRYPEKGHVDKKNSDEFITKHQKMTENSDKNHYDLFVPETILAPRRRIELRILICFNSRNQNGMLRTTTFCNENKVKSQVLNISKRDKNTLIKLKFFLWPNYRLEDFACMNRYWFDTNNGSRFSMVKIHMYPQFKN